MKLSGVSIAATGLVAVASTGFICPSSDRPCSGLPRASVDVQVAPQPAGVDLGAGRAHLPVVPGGEVRHVGIGVADPRGHDHLARGVQIGQRRGRRMPGQARILAERLPRARRDRQRGTQLRYSGSSVGASTDSASMPPARKIDTSTGLSGPCVAAAWAIPSPQRLAAEPEPAGAIDRQQTPGGTEQEAAAVEAGPGGHRHARIPLARTRRPPGGQRPAHGLSPGEAVAAAARLVLIGCVPDSARLPFRSRRDQAAERVLAQDPVGDLLPVGVDSVLDAPREGEQRGARRR